MHRSHLSLVLFAGALVALLLAGCTPPAVQPQPVVPTAAPSQADTPAPPPTAVPATSTTEPTEAPATATPAAEPATPTPEAAPAAGSSFPVTLNDDTGREVTLAARPASIVSLAPSITEILFAVGAGPQVVGVTKYCDYPADAKEGREIVGGFSADSISVEKIVSLKPDLVFASGSAHKSVAEALQAAGITVFNLDAADVAGVYADIVAAATLAGDATAGKAVADGMKARIEKISSAAATIPADERVKVFYEVWDEPLMSAGPKSFIGQLIELAGGENIFSDVEEQYPMVSGEAVVSRNPDVIVGPDSHGDALTADRILARPGWQDLAAVKGGRIVIVDGNMISRPGPRLADALEAVARGIYADRFR